VQLFFYFINHGTPIYSLFSYANPIGISEVVINSQSYVELISRICLGHLANVGLTLRNSSWV
jgi:hypothetical protein